MRTRSIISRVFNEKGIANQWRNQRVETTTKFGVIKTRIGLEILEGRYHFEIDNGNQVQILAPNF